MALTTNSLENGTLTLLVVKGFTGVLGDDLDTNDDGTLDAVPWVELVDSVAVNDGGIGDLTYYGPTLGPNFDGLDPSEPGGASRIPDGQDTETTNDWRRNDFDLAGIPGHTGTPVFGEARNTPEAANEAVAEACGDASTHIYAVQGSGATSPLVGGSVAVEGIVVGDFQAGMDGYALQEAPGDGNGATSDGVFISAPGGTAVNPGDLVRVRGTVAESGGRTQINAAQAWVCSSGNALPAPTALTLPMAAADAFEPYEGMRVAFSQTLFISEYYNFDRYGEIVLTTTRQDTPTAVVEPGAAAVALAAANALARLTLDDGRTTENPDPAIHPSGGVFDLTNRFRGGDTVAGVTGVMDYAFDKYRVQPTQGAAYTAANPRPASPPAVGGTLRVASFNVLNYFTTLNSRGANTAEEFTRQRTKIIAALAAINADVVGLIEIENNTAAIADLVTGLNAAMGAGTYAYIDTGVIGGDEIKVALIYKPATVTPYGAHAVLTSAVDARFDSSKNRPALAQSFLNPATHGIFTVVVNHLKSKGSDCGAGDPDLGDGAGNCNLTRRNAALALVDWLADDPTGSGDEDFLIIGDLNSYDKEDPIDALVAGGYTDLIGLYQGEHAYTYVFDGQAGYLDYALAGAALMEEVTGATVWHINADEPDLLDYDMTYKQPPQDALYEPNAYRSSDHDAVIVGLGLESDLPGAFGKLSPADGSTRQGVSVTLTWQAAPLATGYWYCYDTSNDDLCAGWVSAGTATSATISGLSYNTTYYWQVKAGNGVGYSWANGSVGAHWSFSTHTLTTTTLLSVAANDGWILESEESSGKGSTTLDATSETARVGDDAADRQYRSILDFDTAGLPDGAVIVGVTLRVKWQSSTGKNPFNTLSPLRVDVKKGPFQGNVGLEKYDFQAAASRPAAGRIVKAPEAGWYRMVLASARFGLVNLTGHTQFRLRFATDDDDDGVADYMSFFTGNAAQGNQPELIITYYVP
jgi:predicted extracellular nuclease